MPSFAFALCIFLPLRRSTASELGGRIRGWPKLAQPCMSGSQAGNVSRYGFRDNDSDMPDSEKLGNGKRTQPTAYNQPKHSRQSEPNERVKAQQDSQQPRESQQTHGSHDQPAVPSQPQRVQGTDNLPKAAGLRSTKGKGKGGGSKGGRESDRSSGIVTVQELVELERRAIVRVMQRQREDQAHVAFIVELDEALVELRGSLEDAANTWKSARPSRGPHPDGELHHVQLHILRTFVRDYYNTMELATQEDHRWMETLRGFYNALNPEESKRDWDTCTRKFHPLGQRNRQPRGPWYWLLEFDHATKRGREAHEWVHDLLATMQNRELRVEGVTLRKERGTMDALERALRDSRLE